MKVLLARAYSSYENVTSLGLKLTPPALKLIRDARALIRSGAAGDVRTISGLELISPDVFMHPETVDDALELPGSAAVSCGYNSVALLDQEHLPGEDDENELNLDWKGHSLETGHLKIDEDHLWLIAFQKHSEDRYASGRIDLGDLFRQLGGPEDVASTPVHVAAQAFAATATLSGTLPSGWSVSPSGTSFMDPDGTWYVPEIGFERVTRQGQPDQKDSDYTLLNNEQLKQVGFELLYVVHTEADLEPLNGKGDQEAI